MRTILTIIAAAAWALLASPASAAGTVTLANGGQYFTASGPAAYWRYDQGQGYCGHVAAWCAPAQAQWTYVNRGYGDVNGGRWQNPYPVYAPEFASAFIPARDATATAHYTLRYNYGAYWSRDVDQRPYYDQWVRINQGGLAMLDSVMLGDQSWYGTASDKVAFDEIKIEN